MASHFHILGCIASFVDQATMHPAWSPACGKLLGTECDTHTEKSHTHTSLRKPVHRKNTPPQNTIPSHPSLMSGPRGALRNPLALDIKSSSLSGHASQRPVRKETHRPSAQRRNGCVCSDRKGTVTRKGRAGKV